MLDMVPSDVTPQYALETGDEVILDKTAWTVLHRLDGRYAFLPQSGHRVPQEFTNAQLAHYAALGKLTHTPVTKPVHSGSAYAEMERAKYVASRTPDEHQAAKRRQVLVQALLELHREKRVKFTEDSIAAAKEDIIQRAEKLYALKVNGDTVRPAWHSPKTLLRWKKAFQQKGAIGLYDNRRGRGNREARHSPELNAFVLPIIAGFMHGNQPTQSQIHEDVCTAITLENERRRRKHEMEGGKGEPPLLLNPSRDFIRRKILQLDPFESHLARFGHDSARDEFSPVGEGFQAERPLQVVMFDEYHTDLKTIVGKLGVWDFIPAEMKERLSAKKKIRVWVTMAIDAATRCILGMTISLTCTAESALATMAMIFEDKHKLAEATGAQSSWHMHGKPGLILGDCGEHNISERVRQAAIACGLDYEHCPAGDPRQKGRIERMFDTIGVQLMGRLSGRTFRSVAEKGDSDPDKTAALTVEEFCQILTRWIVDVYHLKPHKGLSKETPFDCWNRLSRKFGVTPPPNKNTRLLAFGQEETRELQRDGITIMNIRYHNRVLAKWMMRHRKRKMTVRWHPSDLGVIFVKLGNADWIRVPAVHSWAKGLTAREWRLALVEINARCRRSMEVNALVIAKAIQAIKEINDEAVRREGVIHQAFSEEEVQRIEDSFLMSFDFPEEKEPAVDVAAKGSPAPRYGTALRKRLDNDDPSGVRNCGADFGNAAPNGVAAVEEAQVYNDEEALDEDEVLTTSAEQSNSVTTSSETDPKSFSAPDTSNVLPRRRRSGRSAPDASDDTNGFTFEE